MRVFHPEVFVGYRICNYTYSLNHVYILGLNDEHLLYHTIMNLNWGVFGRILIFMHLWISYDESGIKKPTPRLDLLCNEPTSQLMINH